MKLRRDRQILLVEDDPRDVELIQQVLKDGKLVNELDVANDGVEALAYLRRSGAWSERPPGDPALVLLDLKLPGMSGLECLKEIRADEDLKALPVVVLTSSVEEKDRLRSYDYGANAYVVKPVRFADFVEAVNQIGRFWLLLNEPPGRRLEE